MDAFHTTELIEKVIASRFDCNPGAFPEFTALPAPSATSMTDHPVSWQWLI
jgi:hypothetical protein